MLSSSRVILLILILVIMISSFLQLKFVKTLEKNNNQRPCIQDNAGVVAFNATFLLVTSIIGMIGTCFKAKSLQAIYLWIMLILTISSFVYVSFISILMPTMSAQMVWAKSKDGYWLNEYRPGLQKALINGKDWFSIRNCYVEFNVCDMWRNQSDTPDNDSAVQGRKYVELGCCYPPARCKLVRKNSTSWETPMPKINPNDKECVHWTTGDNVGECYDCDSCKAGYLSKYQEGWQEGTFWHVFRLMFLAVVSSLSLYAFHDDRKARLEHYT